jgi:fructosamine-3-kinase
MDPLAATLGAAFGGRWRVQALNASAFTGTWRARAENERCFVKTLPAPQRDALEAEADGLAALAATRTIRVPAVRGAGVHEGIAWLALEWLDFARADAGFGERFGAALGALHAAAPEDGRFGWRRDNYIGATPQRSRRHASWPTFFASERLAPMRERLTTHAELCRAVAAVEAVLPRCFEDGHVPRASLIHGDLWSGNWGCLADGTPVTYDPAVSVSDAEAELAMMELFGSPPSGFWPAYEAAAGLHAGYRRRAALYQLYHLLNHAVLFGGAYPAQALQVARRFAP